MKLRIIIIRKKYILGWVFADFSFKNPHGFQKRIESF
jgi:hypothetical protein